MISYKKICIIFFPSQFIPNDLVIPLTQTILNYPTRESGIHLVIDRIDLNDRDENLYIRLCALLSAVINNFDRHTSGGFRDFNIIVNILYMELPDWRLPGVRMFYW